MAAVFSLLEISPWSGRPINPEVNPHGPVRVLAFGAAGLITYLILDGIQRVDVLVVTWAH